MIATSWCPLSSSRRWDPAPETCRFHLGSCQTPPANPRERRGKICVIQKSLILHAAPALVVYFFRFFHSSAIIPPIIFYCASTFWLTQPCTENVSQECFLLFLPSNRYGVFRHGLFSVSFVCTCLSTAIWKKKNMPEEHWKQKKNVYVTNLACIRK